MIAESTLTPLDAAKLMRDYHAGSYVVIEDRNGLNYPVGIVADRDIVIEVIARELNINSVTLGDMLSRELVLGAENNPVYDAIKVMRQKGIRRLPVVDERGALIGIVTLDHLVNLIAEQLQDLTGLIGKEQNQEKKYR